MPTLLWFRRDLRLHDLPALLDAAAQDGDVLACYVLDPRLKASSGPRRLQYLYDALRDVRDQLDGRLLVTRGRPEKRIPKLVKEIGATSVHTSADYTPFGRKRDDAVRDALGEVPLEDAGSPYLVSPGRVTKSDGSPYKVFTPFYAAWQRHGWRTPADSSTDTARWIDPADVAAGVDIPDAGVELDLPAGETAAHKQWAKFVDSGLDYYADDRNRPDLDVTSRMSAHLKFGAIHPRTMARARRPICGSWHSAISMRRCSTSGPTARGGTGTSRSMRCRSTRTTRCSRRGNRAAPGSRSSTPECGSLPRRAGCTTGCG
jgi:deoxyribodipyrimidine photo-lyase